MSPTKVKDSSAAPRRTVTPADGGGAPSPTITPGQTAIKPPGSNGATGPGAPDMAPPGIEASGVAAVQAPGAVSTTSVKIGGLWTSDNANNAWCYLNGIGWRKLSPANASAHEALLQLARLARDANATVQCEEDGSVIHQMYVW